ncbi:SRPBCC domain-containing protein [Labedella phragmitis]|uniref:SRPBCC domain-containing protein n=1 Tax=Labedella phragmitis TaxID=2498849 RepID=A0A444PVX0_9MICO|nr:SRPBCC domain-containing protein [Labedella phragmitis]RWZ52007.1 SRPBCC domain-containing protein [Labedella phragmitis]
MTDVILTRRLDAPVDSVWQAFTDLDAFSDWFWPRRLEPRYDLEARVGGTWRVESSVASMAVGGDFSIVSPRELLVFSWRWHGESDESRVEIRLVRARERSTLLEVTHSGIPTDQAATDLRQGWNDCLDRLPAALEERDG